MFLLPSLSVLAVVALGPQAVLGSFKVNLSPVVECKPATIIFSGSDANNHSVPTTLTILPLLDNVQPINIDIPNGASNSTGIQLTFIPLPANTRFIASLDDLQGPSAAASDVTLVAPSNDTTDTTCFGSLPQSADFYQFNGTLNQCQGFSVKYSTSAAPNVTAFIPRGGSTSVAPLSTVDGIATYPAFHNLPREAEVVLLFDDGDGHLQTTQLLLVQGDSTSPKTCFSKHPGSSSNDSSDTKMTSAGLPRSAVIGIAVGASVVGVLAVLALFWFIRFRRRNRNAARDMEFDPTLLNRRWPPDEKQQVTNFIPYQSPTTFTAPMAAHLSGEGFVRDPIYTNEKYASSIVSVPRTSISSWNQFVPYDQRSVRTKSWDSSNQKTPQGATFQQNQRPASTVSTASMNTEDVQDFLQMATGDRTSGADLTEVPITPQASTIGGGMVAKPAVARLASLSRKTRTPDSESGASAADLSRNDSTNAAVFAGGPYSYVNFESDSDQAPALAATPADGHLRNRDSGPPPSTRAWDNGRDYLP